MLITGGDFRVVDPRKALKQEIQVYQKVLFRLRNSGIESALPCVSGIFCAAGYLLFISLHVSVIEKLSLQEKGTVAVLGIAGAFSTTMLCSYTMFKMINCIVRSLSEKIRKKESQLRILENQ